MDVAVVEAAFAAAVAAAVEVEVVVGPSRAVAAGLAFDRDYWDRR